MQAKRIGTLLQHLQFIAANTREHRRRAGMTQEQLAEAAGLDLRYVQRVERASANLSMAVLISLAHALGVGPNDLLRTARFEPGRAGRPRRGDRPEPAGRDATTEDKEPESTLRPRRRGPR